MRTIYAGACVQQGGTDRDEAIYQSEARGRTKKCIRPLALAIWAPGKRTNLALLAFLLVYYLLLALLPLLSAK